MTFRPDKSLLAAGVLGVVAIAAFTGIAPLIAAPGDDAIAEALAALERGDGIAAEISGKRAIEQGAARSQVAALIGEGEFLQGDFRDARNWLGDAEFDDETRRRGLLALARLEVAEKNTDAAMQIFGQLVEQGNADALVWVDIGRLRYAIGAHHAALEAAREAVRLDLEEPRALEFLAQLVRDSQGFDDALPIFRQALETAPDDAGLLAQYAATLGDAGQHAQMLGVVRQLIEKDPNALYAYYLQAVLAARAGEDDLARQIWWHTDGDFDRTGAGLLVSGVLEYRAGNPALAVEKFDELRRLQPFNETALLLFARALVANGEANVAVDVLQPFANRTDASSYLLTLIARGYEQLGRRELAAPYLDRANALVRTAQLPIPALLPRDSFGEILSPENPVMQLRQQLSQGRYADARSMVSALLAQYPGSVDLEMLAGDVELLARSPDTALEFYRQAASVRSGWPLVRRIAVAHGMSGRDTQARGILADHLAGRPRDQQAAAMLGRMHRDAGHPARAAVFLRHAASFGSGKSDPLLLADLAEVELVLGKPDAAQAHANRANILQRGNRHVARALARAIEMANGQEGASDAAAVQSLYAKWRGTGFAAAGQD